MKNATTSAILARAGFAAVLMLAACVPALIVTKSPLAAPTRGAGGHSDVLASPQSSLQQLRAEAESVRDTMARLEAETQDLATQLGIARDKLASATTELAAARLKLKQSEAKLGKQRKLVSNRITAIYKAGQYSWLDLVASSSSMSDAQVVMGMMRKISEQDKAQEIQLREMTADARNLTRQVQAEREAAISAHAEIRARRTDIMGKRAEREAELTALVTRIKKILATPKPPKLKVTPGGEMTQVTWATSLLSNLGMPLTQDNIAAIVAWEMAEGGHWCNSAHYNPLNTSQPMPGAATFNSHGVKVYTSWEMGLQATVITLRNGLYDGILAALRAGNDGQAVASAVAASPWGTGYFDVP
jgi:peptidoglycan hydrolase CwlO-like protein